WRVTMSRYNFEIHHVPGEVHVVADMFSRWAHPEFDRGAITLGVADAGAADTGELQEGAARMVSSREAVTADAELLRFDPTDFPSLGDIRQAQLEHVSLADHALFGLKEDITNRVLVNDAGQIFVPDARSLRQRLCVVAHQGEAGHRGIDNTLRLLNERFVWPNIENDVRTYVRQCLHCLRARGGRKVPRPWGDTLHANGAHQVLHFDFMFVRAADASTDHEYQYTLVIMDGFSRFVELVPSARADASTAVNALIGWFSRYGRVHTFVSDQGSHFNNRVMKMLRDALGISHHFTAVYAPWSNGRVERVNREIRELLTMLRSARRRRWV
ncbi:DDE-type integrase/transposase/recombinase, partial [Silvimonas sp.]|uniref:DDE-type integrase/transposase/recombinase n=1 Tax=Silvimonas sp. TaxID=2650811 RepID=UPI0028423C05